MSTVFVWRPTAVRTPPGSEEAPEELREHSIHMQALRMPREEQEVITVS